MFIRVSFVVIISIAIPFLLSCGTETAGREIPVPATVDSPFNSIEVTGNTVNLRSGPGTQYEILGTAEKGDVLMVTGGLDDWYRIYDPSKSLFAWIYARLTSGTDLP